MEFKKFGLVVLLNIFPHDKFSEWSKLKVFAHDKINVIEKVRFVLGRIENIVEKGENAGLPAFSPFPTMFSRAFFFKVVKSRDCFRKG